MSWLSPFSSPGRWLKGNLHTHTTQSDGLQSPEQAIAWYRDRGYDFCAVTDHWVYTPGRVIDADFCTLAGAELHGPGYHMLALGISSLPDRELEGSPAALASAIRAQGGLAYFAHPYWTGQTSAEIATVADIAGIEVFNAVCENMDGLGYSSIHWDELLAQGRRLTGLAVDDVHWKHGAEGQAFVMVRAETPQEDKILNALRLGHFYASTGPCLMDLCVVSQAGQPALRVRCSPCQSITFYAKASLGHRFSADAPSALDTAIYPIKPDQVYLRVECRDHRGKIAWSNPVFVADVLG